MRLINANALMAEMHNVIIEDGEDRRTFYEVIERQPTIEERKKGKWIVYKAPDKYHCGLCKCPFCGEEMIAESDEYNFCPNCGADMRGEMDAGNKNNGNEQNAGKL